MRRVNVVRGVLIVLTLMLLAPVASAADQENFYLGPDGFPTGSLVANPRGGEMPNYDLGRDIEPGLLLERSNLGLDETEETKYQHWQVEMGGESVEGHPSVVIWTAPARFDSRSRGALSIFLLDCNRGGADCRELGAAEATIEVGQGAIWVESRVDFEPIDHRFDVGRYLGVRILVPEASESDMMLAYGYPDVRSRLTIFAEAPPPPLETAVAPTVSVPDNSELLAEKRVMLDMPDLATPVSAVDVEAVGTPWTWVVSLVLSTSILILIAAFLVSRLTRPGRHEQRFVVDTPRPELTERIKVSAR